MSCDIFCLAVAYVYGWPFRTYILSHWSQLTLAWSHHGTGGLEKEIIIGLKAMLRRCRIQIQSTQISLASIKWVIKWTPMLLKGSHAVCKRHQFLTDERSNEDGTIAEEWM